MSELKGYPLGTATIKTSAQRLNRARQLYHYHRNTAAYPWFDGPGLTREVKKVARKLEISADPMTDDSQALMYLDVIALRMGIDINPCLER